MIKNLHSLTTKNVLDIALEMTHLVNDCLGDVNSSVSSGFRLHAALSASLGLLLGLPLGLGGFLAEHGGEVEHIGSTVEGGLTPFHSAPNVFDFTPMSTERPSGKKFTLIDH